jgi:hypothetical protein
VSHVFHASTLDFLSSLIGSNVFVVVYRNTIRESRIAEEARYDYAAKSIFGDRNCQDLV